MGTVTQKIFQKKTAVRILVMALITALLSVCTWLLGTKLFDYLLADQPDHILESLQGTMLPFAVSLSIVFVSSILAIPLFFHFTRWFLPSLRRGFLSLICGIPIVNLLIPPHKRRGFYVNILKEIKDSILQDLEDEGHYEYVMDQDGNYTRELVYDHACLGTLFFLPITLALQFLAGMLLCLINLGIAFFLPLLSPAFAVLGGLCIAEVLDATGSSVLLAAGCALELLLMAFFFVGIPVISLRKNK